MRFHLLTVRGVAIVALLILLVVLPQFVSAFYINLYTRIMIWAIAAVSLNLILGYGGMISFGHAAYMGVAAYVVLTLADGGNFNGFVQWPMAIAASGVVALVVGSICLRTRGLYFIMITLAFTQMIFFFTRSLDRFGGDDGQRIRRRSEFDFGFFESNLMDREIYYYLVFVILLLALFLVYRLVNSRFGMVLRASMSNDARLQAVGVSSYSYRLTAFVIAGLMGGLAGVLMANMVRFVSPDMLSWVISGDLIFIVVLGGTGRLFGPVFGAVAFFLLQRLLGDLDRHYVSLFGACAVDIEAAVTCPVHGFIETLAEHWKLLFGPFLILVVLFARGGIDGVLEALDRRLRSRFAKAPAAEGETS